MQTADQPVPHRQTKPKGEGLSTWQARNPLRLWRAKQPPEGWNRSVLARQLGVSHSSVEAWEKGARLPVIDAFERIEALTGISTREWMSWFRSEHEQRRAGGEK